MNGRTFLDTNVVVYAFTSDDPRSEKAKALLAAGGIISIQVLNEFVNVSRTKTHRQWDEIEDALGALRVLLAPPRPLTMEVHETAIVVAREYGYHFYDSLIVASALRAGCSLLYSEDFHHGQTIDQLTIHNPFLNG